MTGVLMGALFISPLIRDGSLTT